jgi:CHAT domain-containing protein
MSLWKVPDRATRELMEAYYGGLLRGEGRGEALRRVQLRMLRQPATRHPFYWAGFIQSGAWSPLDGGR